jgi:hypothetical protein
MVDREGAPLGRIVHVYLDVVSGEPEWALVTSGRKDRLVFVPLVDATEQQDQIGVPVQRTLVADAPAIRPGRRLSKEDTARLHGHYGGAPELRWGSARRMPGGRPPACGKGWIGLASGLPACPGLGFPAAAGCSSLARPPPRWPAACCWSGAAGESGRPAWPPPSAGPSGGYWPCPPERCVGGAADGGYAPWSGRRPRPWPRQGGPPPGLGVVSRSRPGRCSRECRGTGGDAWQAT